MCQRMTAMGSFLCLLIVSAGCSEEDASKTTANLSTIKVYEADRGDADPLETHTLTKEEFVAMSGEQPRMAVDDIPIAIGGRGTFARLRVEGVHKLTGLDDLGQTRTEATVSVKRLTEGGIAIEVIEPAFAAGTTLIVSEPDKCAGTTRVSGPLFPSEMVVEVKPSEDVGCDLNDYVLNNLLHNMLLDESFTGGWQVALTVGRLLFVSHPGVLAAAVVIGLVLLGFSWWNCNRTNSAIIAQGDAEWARDCFNPRIRSRTRSVSGGSCPFIGTQVPARYDIDCQYWPPPNAIGAPLPSLDGGTYYPPDAGSVSSPDGGTYAPPDGGPVVSLDAGTNMCGDETEAAPDDTYTESGEDAESWEPGVWDNFTLYESDSYPCEYY